LRFLKETCENAIPLLCDVGIPVTNEERVVETSGAVRFLDVLRVMETAIWVGLSGNGDNHFANFDDMKLEAGDGAGNSASSITLSWEGGISDNEARVSIFALLQPYDLVVGACPSGLAGLGVFADGDGLSSCQIQNTYFVGSGMGLK
jgi:hypothetical protein